MKKMAIAVVALASIVATSGFTSASAAPLGTDDVSINIVGGRVTPQTQPWIADLGFCTATLVGKRWVLTAAHCLGMGSRSIKIGSNDRNNRRDGQTLPIARTIKHPKWGSNEPGYDIGLIELMIPAKSEPMKISAVRPTVGTKTLLMGWGRTTPDGRGSTALLKELDTSIVAPSRCEATASSFDGTRELCTDNPGGTEGACSGDSGGPQLTQVNGEWRLVGVTHGGPRLCASAPSIYESTAFHMDWITQATGGEVKASN